jgi:threonine dehydratase
MGQSIPRFADVAAAATRIKGVALETPLIESPVLNERVRARVLLKLETLQRTGSFKFRGAYNRLVQLTPDERKHGVVAFSSGNHAQGVAAAARILGMPATIVMPSDAPRIKLENTRALGAEIVPFDRKRDKREEIAARIASEKGAVVVPAFDDLHIVAGQGTAGLEIARQARALGVTLDAVLAPCSGGGLSSGIALALSHETPTTRLFAVEPVGFDGARLSIERGERTAAAADGLSIADSLMAPAPGLIPFALFKATDAGRRRRCRTRRSCRRWAMGSATEAGDRAGGAAALAAILSGAFDATGKTIAIVLSGGNIDPEMLARCLNA